MRKLVVDASAAIGMLAAERRSDRVTEVICERRIRLVPALFWLEVLNVLGRRHRWPASQVVASIHDLEQLGLRTATMSRPMLLAVIDALEGHRLTAYDATYLVLAEAADADLLTADAFLAAAAGERAILVGQEHRLAEARARYEAGRQEAPGWPRWPGAASYLAKLRREIEAERRSPGRGATP